MKIFILSALISFLFVNSNAMAIQLGSPLDSSLGQKYKKELESFIVPKNHLPFPCKLSSEIKTSPIFPAKQNPNITDNEQLIAFVALMGFGEKQLREIEVAMSALYFAQGSRDEVGIWGLRFKTENSAIAFVDNMRQKRREVLRKDSLIISLWRDNETGKACQDAINSKLINNGFKIVTTKPLPGTPADAKKRRD